MQQKILAHPWGAYAVLTFVVLLSHAVFYAPFILNGTLEELYRYWDGPNYLLVAKTLYSIPVDHPLSPYTKPAYFAAHLPLYPFVIRIFSFMGYEASMLFTSTLFTWAATLTFYQLLKENKWVASPMWSAIISLYIPARYLIYHSVGATEAPFIFLISASLLFYLRGNYWLAFLMGGFAGITRITGVLLGVAYFIDLLIKRKWLAIPWLALIGLPLLLTFTFYAFTFGDFFAYLNVNLSNSNKLLHLQPFEIFNVYSGSGDTHSAEFYLFMYGAYGLGTALLWSVNRSLFLIVAVMFTFNCFIFHQDLARYFIPIAPFALVVAYDQILNKAAAKVLFIPFAVLAYIYAWKVIPHNLAVDWVYKNLKVFLN